MKNKNVSHETHEIKHPDQHMLSQPISETLEKNYMPYAMSVIVSRAIPEIDGFKPAHRKLLYTMYKMGLLSGNRTKSANVVGQTMRLNPHGDASIYETMVRLTRGNASLLYPYVDSKGNMGKHYSRDMAYAASRYTEVKLDKFAEEIFAGLDKNSTDFVDNYDGTMKEPLLFPTTFPNVLVNANQGIAVGMASNICSFNLKEVCDATISIIKKDKQNILDIMPAPDFSTGGTILYDKNEMNKIYKTGKGSIRVRGIYRVNKKDGIIDIIEIPYSTTIEAIIEDVTSLVKNNKIKEINDIRDETDLSGLKISIDYKRGTDPDVLMQKLYKMTKLEDSFACNFNILVDGTPRVMGVYEIIDEWHKWRRECLKRELAFELQKKEKKLHLLKGLEKILIDIDKVVTIIRGTEKDEEVIPTLMKAYEIDEEQANFIAEIKLRNINKEYVLNKIKEIETLEKDIASLKKTISTPSKIDKLIIATLQSVAKKYGKARKSVILNKNDIEDIPLESMTIVEQPSKIYITKEGYLKKIALTSLRTSPEIKLKENDEILNIYDTVSTAEILFFTNHCNIYKAKVNTIPFCKPSDFGEFYNNIIDCEENEEIIHIQYTTDFKEILLIAFKNGKIAKLPLSLYETKQNRKKLINAFSGVSPIAKIVCIPQDTEFAIISDDNKVIVLDSSKISLKTSKTTQGIQCLKLIKTNKLKDLILISDINFKLPPGCRCRSLPATGKKFE